MAEPQKIISIGNVTYSQDEVANHTIKEQGKQKIHCVWLKNGLSLEYPRQEGEGGSVMVIHNGDTWFRDLNGATIRGSKNRDLFTILGCKNSKVDISGDEKLFGGDEVFVSKDFPNKNVAFKRDDGDRVIVPPTGTIFTKMHNEFNTDWGALR